jgi:hypothetical protein
MVRDEENPSSSSSSSSPPFESPTFPLYAPYSLPSPPQLAPSSIPPFTHPSFASTHLTPSYPPIESNHAEFCHSQPKEEQGEAPRNVWYYFRGQRSKIRVTNDYMDVDDMKHMVAELFHVPFHTLIIERNGELLEPNDPLRLYCSDGIALTIKESGVPEAVLQASSVFNSSVAIVENSSSSNESSTGLSCLRWGIYLLVFVILVLLLVTLLQRNSKDYFKG